MIQLFLPTLIAGLGIILSCSTPENPKSFVQDCDCDTLQTKNFVTNKYFNRIAKYDTSSFAKEEFYELDSSINKMLWYRDIENIDTTKFTNLWNDYFPANYHASNLDFVKFYQGKKDIEIAFQFGPNMDLWAYHIFIIKKVGCCYLVCRSYFRHARFTYKAYSIINGKQLDSLYSVINDIHIQKIIDREEFNYCGYFVDNRNSRKFFIDFEKEIEKNKEHEEQQPKKEVKALYDFIDKKIVWTKTYGL